jgi:hypothetical protein
MLKNKWIMGQGPVKVLVLSQIFPTWEEGHEIFESFFEQLNDQCTFEIYDSLEKISDFKEIHEYAMSFRELLSQSEASIIMGFSFGGSILQYFLHDPLLKEKKVIFVSVPTVISPGLYRKLSRIINFLEVDQMKDALDLLSFYVLNQDLGTHEGKIVPEELEESRVATKKERLLKGFQFLLGHNRKYDIENSVVPILNLYGENSQLVNSNDMVSSVRMQNIKVPRAGMRVIADDIQFTSNTIKNFIRGEFA